MRRNVYIIKCYSLLCQIELRTYIRMDDEAGRIYLAPMVDEIAM